MKKKQRSQLPADAKKDFNDGIALITKAIMSDGPIAPEEKEGAKLSNKEASGLSFALEHLAKFESKLPRDFEEAKTQEELTELLEWIDMTAAIDRVKKAIESRTTTLRVNLKSHHSTVYTAVKDAASKDSSATFILTKMAEAYAREPTKSASTKIIKE